MKEKLTCFTIFNPSPKLSQQARAHAFILSLGAKTGGADERPVEDEFEVVKIADREF